MGRVWSRWVCGRINILHLLKVQVQVLGALAVCIFDTTEKNWITLVYLCRGFALWPLCSCCLHCWRRSSTILNTDFRNQVVQQDSQTKLHAEMNDEVAGPLWKWTDTGPRDEIIPWFVCFSNCHDDDISFSRGEAAKPLQTLSNTCHRLWSSLQQWFNWIASWWLFLFACWSTYISLIIVHTAQFYNYSVILVKRDHILYRIYLQVFPLMSSDRQLWLQ